MIIALAALLFLLPVAYLLFIRPADIPGPAPVSPFAHLDERKASIYENLRDLQFEYRVGKMSDADYQRSKTDLQRELARVLEEVDRVAQGQPVKSQPAPPAARPKRYVCKACRAEFDKRLKFCGECGQPMEAGA